MTDLLLALNAALLGVLLLAVLAVLLVLRTFAGRVLGRLGDVSDEHLPAIRSALSDVVDVLIPPGGVR